MLEIDIKPTVELGKLCNVYVHNKAEQKIKITPPYGKPYSEVHKGRKLVEILRLLQHEEGKRLVLSSTASGFTNSKVYKSLEALASISASPDGGRSAESGAYTQRRYYSDCKFLSSSTSNPHSLVG